MNTVTLSSLWLVCVVKITPEGRRVLNFTINSSVMVRFGMSAEILIYWEPLNLAGVTSVNKE